MLRVLRHLCLEVRPHQHALLLVRVRPGDERPRRPVRRAERLVWHPGGDVSTSPACPVSTCSRSGPRRKELDPSSTWIADSWASCRAASTPRGRTRRCRHSPSAPLLSAEMPAEWSSPALRGVPHRHPRGRSGTPSSRPACRRRAHALPDSGSTRRPAPCPRAAAGSGAEVLAHGARDAERPGASTAPSLSDWVLSQFAMSTKRL